MANVVDFVDRYGKQKYLAVSLFFFLIADAFFPGNRFLTYSILALMIITGPMATARTGLERLGTIGLALVMVLLGYWSAYSRSEVMLFGASLVGVVFFFTLIFLISRALLFEQKQITGETLWAAVNVYILLGMLFAFIYSLVVIVEPGAFAGGFDAEGGKPSQTFVYYSFVTMTTLGYGDITPEIPVAAMFAYLQALIGQLYVAILIARLVSIYSAEPR